MNQFWVLLLVGSLMLALEAAFFLYCFRWLSAGKRQRERDFALLDRERQELLQLQRALAEQGAQASTFASETTRELQRLGSAVHAEWNEAEARMGDCIADVEGRVRGLMEGSLEELARQRMALEKAEADGVRLATDLEDKMQRAARLLRFFDKNVPTETIAKELQMEKYSEARNLLRNGQEASAIARKLGLSLSEIDLLSRTGMGA